MRETFTEVRLAPKAAPTAEPPHTGIGLFVDRADGALKLVTSSGAVRAVEATVVLGGLSGRVTTIELTTIPEAISTASADATSKANTAESNAISTASADATSKANTAESNAIQRANHTGTQLAETISDLGSAALTDSSDYATAAQGDKADTALQPNAPATVTTLTVTGDTISEQDGILVADYIFVDELKVKGGNVVQIVETVPSSKVDFSGFVGGVAPTTGVYEALDSRYLYKFKAGWSKWRRTAIGEWEI